MDATEEINSELDAIITEKVPKEAVNKFKALLTRLEGKPDSYILEAVVKISNSISQDAVTVISARQICAELIAHVDKFTDDSLAITNFQVLLSRMQSRIIAFEAQLIELRDLLAKRLMATGQLQEAAVILSGMPLESGQRSYSVEYKLGIYLRIVECYLSLNNPIQAEIFMNRASLLQNDSKDLNLIMRFKAAYARLLDFKQKFTEAGQRYAELSIRFPEMEEAERTAFLERALLSALLAGAGQQRARLLATLYKDERCKSLQAYPILEKMYMRRLINRDSLHSLRPLLIHYYPQLFAPACTSSTSDKTISVATGDESAAVAQPADCPTKTDDKEGVTAIASASYQQFLRILERVVVEHNMLAASLIYTNISLTNLGELLEVEPNQAEAIAAQMIGEDRLEAKIDQIDGFIYFQKENPAVTLSTQIQNLWTSVNSIIEGIENDHPAWVAAQST